MNFWDKLQYGHQKFKDLKLTRPTREWKGSCCRILFDAKNTSDIKAFDPFLQICTWSDACIGKIGQIQKMLLVPKSTKASKALTGMAQSSAASAAESSRVREVKAGVFFF